MAGRSTAVALVGACWPEMETWVLAGWVLASNGDIGVCWPEMETWVLAGWGLPSNGDMSVLGGSESSMEMECALCGC